MKKIILILVAMLFMYSCKHKTIDEKIFEDTRNEMLKTCPQQVVEDVMLDSITYNIEKQQKTYYYTLSGFLDNQERIDSAKEDFSNAIKNNLIKAIILKEYKKLGITYRYVYFSGSTKKKMLDIKYDLSKL